MGSFAMNCYLVCDEDSREAIFIDPGAEAERLIDEVKKENLNLKKQWEI